MRERAATDQLAKRLWEIYVNANNPDNFQEWKLLTDEDTRVGFRAIARAMIRGELK